ncbi:MAG: Gfo/Idh/MocA family protein [Phycisphaerales bacterium JB059]
MPPPLRDAMVGGGTDAFIGAVHRLAAALDGRARLVAGALSSTPQRSLDSAKALGLDPDRAYESYQQLIERESARPESERVDFVSVVTPNHLHHPIVKACLEAGLHVVCDKPFTMTSAQALELRDLAARRNLLCAVTYNYTGYPLVREMRSIIASGILGPIRKVFAEYHQGWLATPLEQTGMKQASWRTDPERAGIAGALGDIGTHAENLVSFVTALEIESLCADLTAFVPGRTLDDDASVLLRFKGGAKGSLTCSQVCVGEENGLTLRVYAESGGLIWRQERPNLLEMTSLDGDRRLITRGGDRSPDATNATRLPPGHPEGFIEAFANLYRGVCDAIEARRDGRNDASNLTPTADDGLRGVRFVERCVQSAQLGSGWISWDD